jgi:lipopolysaccharide-induced tumor necrosis factor-alpha factor
MNVNSSAWALVSFCLTGLFCFIPYMMSTSKDVNHYCSKCGALLATYHKSGRVEPHIQG